MTDASHREGEHEQTMNLNPGRHVLKPLIGRLLPFGVLALLFSLDASPFDKTPPQWPQLSTSHGPIKSGGTIKEAIQGSIDLLLTDMPMTDAELQQVHDMRGVRLLHVATAVTAVVPCYNLGGLKAHLNFSADTLAAIFLGKITKWNDPAILALNPSAHLPAADIIVIGHAMEDGSTYAWTDFLSKTNTDWRRSIGRVRSLVALPALARGQTSEDLAELVKHTPNSISYTELWAAKGQSVQIGRVKNRSGNCIDPSPGSRWVSSRRALRMRCVPRWPSLRRRRNSCQFLGLPELLLVFTCCRRCVNGKPRDTRRLSSVDYGYERTP